MATRFFQIQEQLTAWFEPEEHQLRDLPGGGSWYFVPWQTIRKRLNTICPESWSDDYSNIQYLDEFCHVTCTLNICGVIHRGVGVVPIKVISSTGKDASRGDPISRAIADSFKTAAEQFGICSYLDDQTSKDYEVKKRFLDYVRNRGQEQATERPQPKNKPVPKVAQPEAQEPEPIQKPLNRLRALTRTMGLTKQAGDKIIQGVMIQHFNGRNTSSLTPDEVRHAVNLVLIAYSLYALPSFEEAEMAFFAATGELRAKDSADEELAKHWLATLRKLSKAS